MSKDARVEPVFQTSRATPEGLAGLLAEVTHEFASSLNVEETLQNAIDQIIVYLNAEAASIFLLEEDGQALICRKCAGPVDVTGLRLRPDQGIVGKTVTQNESQIVRDVSENDNFAAVVDKDSGDRLFAASDMHLATAVASAAALAIHNARMAQALVEQERVRKELELARQIQLSLLPPASRNELPVRGVNIPAREVSGDFYDYCEVTGGRIYFSLADVSGKGMNAALLMAKTTSLLRCLAKTAAGPAELLTQVNAEICETASHGMFVTIVAGYIHPASGLVEFSNAGHQPPVHWRASGCYEELVATAPPIGILPDVKFESTRLQLNGDCLYIFTDGVTESIAPDGTELGVDGLCDIIRAVASVDSRERLDRIVADIYAQERKVHDDLTLLMIETHAHG